MPNKNAGQVLALRSPDRDEGSAASGLTRWSRVALVLQAFVMFHLLLLALRIVPYRWIAQRLPRSASPDHRLSRPGEEALVDAVHAAMETIRRLDYRSREDCLPRALTIHHLLARRGVAADFRIGVRRDPFSAHAWVEYRGRPVGDSRARIAVYRPLSTARASDAQHQ